jgi:hypothetical protein
MQNILLVWITPGEPSQHGFALIHSKYLQEFDLDAIDGKILNQDEVPDGVGDQIERLYKLLGLEPAENEAAGALKQFINRPMLAIPDRVVKFGWSV